MALSFVFSWVLVKPSFLLVLVCNTLFRSISGLGLKEQTAVQYRSMSLYKQRGGHCEQVSVPCRLDREGGLVYRTSVFSSVEYDLFLGEIKRLKGHLRDEESSSVAQHRRGLAVSSDSPMVQRLSDPQNSLTRLVAQLTCDTTMQLAPHIPVEVRTYDQVGACMAWHVDDVLYDPPQIEIVWTLVNTSDCQTRYRRTRRRGRSSEQHGEEEAQEHCAVQTDPNAALVLRAGVTPHAVTSLKRGERVIVKCAYVTDGAVYVGDGDPGKDRGNKAVASSTRINTRASQFGVSHQKSKRNKQRRKKR